MKNYDNLYQKMLDRRNGNILLESSRTKEKFETIQGKVSRYILGAMTPVSEEYTKNTYKEADRVISHLDREMKEVKFKFQGSVTNNTHIKRHSDIDILIVDQRCYSYANPVVDPSRYTTPYKGNPVEDLIEVRHKSTQVIRDNFPKVNINTQKSKCIALSGGSLTRDIDLVPSHDWHTIEYQKTGYDYHIGVQVLDYHNRVRVGNTPFYHNELLSRKDKESLSYFKRAVRLIKTVKVDSDKEIKFSSYDITAILYHMGNSKLDVGNNPLNLVENIYTYFVEIANDRDWLYKLEVPDKSRKIIRGDNDYKEFVALVWELHYLYEELKKEMDTDYLWKKDFRYSFDSINF